MRTKDNSAWWRLGMLAIMGLFMGILFTINGCKKDDNTPEPQSNSITKTMTSTDPGGVLTLEGQTLIITPSSIPLLASGGAATVNFTIEVGGALPKAFPSNMKLVGKSTHFGPEGFIFAEPMFVLFKIPDGISFDQVSIIGFDNESNSYGVYPITYYDPDKKEVGTNVYQLGYYMLANVTDINRTRAPFGSGAFRINQFDNKNWYPQTGGQPSWLGSATYQKLIITNFVPTYPEEMSLWTPYDPNSNGGRRYWEAMTPPHVTGWGPDHNIGITFRGPQGTYTAQLINSHKFLQSDWPECKQYSLPFTFTITAPVTCTSANICDGWSQAPVMPGGGTWSDIPCFGPGSYKPLATIPVCTGDFQATLTWFNGSGSYGETDLDLHLYGPNDLHVYWSNKNPGVSNILLDRDMISETGWVQENICAPSLSAMPKGEYRIEVNLFDGDDKDFQVRVIRGSQANSFSGRATQSEPTKKILTFTL